MRAGPAGDFRNIYFQPENLRKTRVARLQPLVGRRESSRGLALRHILHTAAVGTVIPGMRSRICPDSLMAQLKAHPWGPLKWPEFSMG